MALLEQPGPIGWTAFSELASGAVHPIVANHRLQKVVLGTNSAFWRPSAFALLGEFGA